MAEQVIHSLVSTLNSKVTNIETENATVTYEITAASGNLLYENYIMHRTGRVRELDIHGFKNLTTTQLNTIITGLNISDRPASNIAFNIAFLGETYRITVTTTGDILCYPYSGVTNQNNITETITWITN